MVEQKRDDNDLSEITTGVRKYRAIVIFTNQRTGGSNLTEWFQCQHKIYTDYTGLVKAINRLGYSVNYKDENDYTDHDILDEKTGLFKSVIIRYLREKKTNPEKALLKIELFIKTLMSFRPTFKIVSECTPIEISQLVIKYLNYYHYSCILLYRRRSLERNLSLHFSLSTNVYNSDDAKKWDPKVKPTKPITEKELKILIDSQKNVNEINKQIWTMLKPSRSRYAAVSYEDIYGKHHDSAILHIVFRWLFYSVWDFDKLLQNGEQQTKQHYNVEGSEKLKEELAKLNYPRFTNLHVEV